jgi:hypothetical protein
MVSDSDYSKKGLLGIRFYDTVKFLFFLTVIQFWWIAIWGIAYIIIDLISGPSKFIELIVYVLMMVSTFAVVHMNPSLLERL